MTTLGSGMPSTSKTRKTPGTHIVDCNSVTPHYLSKVHIRYVEDVIPDLAHLITPVVTFSLTSR